MHENELRNFLFEIIPNDLNPNKIKRRRQRRRTTKTAKTDIKTRRKKKREKKLHWNTESIELVEPRDMKTEIPR